MREEVKVPLRKAPHAPLYVCTHDHTTTHTYLIRVEFIRRVVRIRVRQRDLLTRAQGGRYREAERFGDRR